MIDEDAFGQAYCTSFQNEAVEAAGHGTFRGESDPQQQPPSFAVTVTCPSCRDDDINCYALIGTTSSGGGRGTQGGGEEVHLPESPLSSPSNFSSSPPSLPNSSSLFCLEVGSMGPHLPEVPVCYTALWHERANVASDPPLFLTERIIHYHDHDPHGNQHHDPPDPSTTTTSTSSSSSSSLPSAIWPSFNETTVSPPERGFLFRLTGNYDVGFGPCLLIWNRIACLSCNPFCEAASEGTGGEMADGFGFDCSNVHPQAVASCLLDIDYTYPFSPQVIAFLGQYDAQLQLQSQQQQHDFQTDPKSSSSPSIHVGWIALTLLVGLLVGYGLRQAGRGGWRRLPRQQGQGSSGAFSSLNWYSDNDPYRPGPAVLEIDHYHDDDENLHHHNRLHPDGDDEQ